MALPPRRRAALRRARAGRRRASSARRVIGDDDRFDMRRRDRIAAVAIGLVGGFIVGLTSVGSGDVLRADDAVRLPARARTRSSARTSSTRPRCSTSPGFGHFIAGNVDLQRGRLAADRLDPRRADRQPVLGQAPGGGAALRARDVLAAQRDQAGPRAAGEHRARGRRGAIGLVRRWRTCSCSRAGKSATSQQEQAPANLGFAAPVPRLLSTLLVVGLLGGTAAAFAITQGLKLEKSPITAPHVDKLFSPVCDCDEGRRQSRFRLRKRRHDDRTVITPDGEPVATIANHSSAAGSSALRRWNGRDWPGAVVAGRACTSSGVHLRQHQTITLPNTIMVDTTPPMITIKRVVPRVFSPDRDGRRRVRHVSYRRLGRRRGRSCTWTERRSRRGRLTRSTGKHPLVRRRARRDVPARASTGCRSRAEDRAGNISPPTSDVRVVAPVPDARRGRSSSAARRSVSRVGSRATPSASSGSCAARRRERARDAPLPRAEEAGPVQALRHLQRPLAGRARGRVEVTAELARAGGPIGCAGLALLLARDSPRPPARRARRCSRWARSSCSPTSRRPAPAAARCRGSRRPGRRGRRRLALPALAVARRRLARSPASLRASRCTSARPSEPAPAALRVVVAGAAVLLAWELVRGDDRARELGPLAWPLAALVAWSGLSLAWTRGPAPGRDRAALLLAAVRPARGRRSRGSPGTGAGSRSSTSQLGGDGARVRVHRRLPVRQPRRLLEPEGDRRQRLRARSTGSTRSSTTRRSTGGSSCVAILAALVIVAVLDRDRRVAISHRRRDRR